MAPIHYKGSRVIHGLSISFLKKIHKITMRDFAKLFAENKFMYSSILQINKLDEETFISILQSQLKSSIRCLLSPRAIQVKDN